MAISYMMFYICQGADEEQMDIEVANGTDLVLLD